MTSTTHTGHLRFRWNRIFKRFHQEDAHREEVMTLTMKERLLRQRNPTDNEANRLESKSSPSLYDSFESLPFTDPYLCSFERPSDDRLTQQQDHPPEAKYIDEEESSQARSTPVISATSSNKSYTKCDVRAFINRVGSFLLN